MAPCAVCEGLLKHFVILSPPVPHSRKAISRPSSERTRLFIHDALLENTLLKRLIIVTQILVIRAHPPPPNLLLWNPVKAQDAKILLVLVSSGGVWKYLILLAYKNIGHPVHTLVN